MAFTLIIGATALSLSLAMAWIAWLTIRRLPDEPQARGIRPAAR